MNPIELVAAHPWRLALFTTYSLSLSFFESVVLDELTRGGTRRTMVVADVDGVRAALGEWGARSVGRAYQVEPIGVDGGIFHPKVTVLSDGRECHLLVGSGNLTFGGWGGNLEVVEHLHPSFASEAFADAADMFEDLASAPRLRHGAQSAFDDVARDLRAAQRSSGVNNSYRLLFGSRGSIAEELAALAGELGGATHLTVVSPFFDKGAALDRLCSLLGLDEAYIHAHPADAVFADQGANWPTNAKCRVKPVTVDLIDDARRLHGKLFEIRCRSGRILASGSANATSAALGAGGNVEAIVARLDRTRGAFWSLTKADAPTLALHADGSDDDPGAKIDVLRATLAGRSVDGRVLTMRIEGDVDVFLVESSGDTRVGAAIVDAEGFFRIEDARLARAAWLSDRLVIAVEDGAGRRAEGFVLAKDFREIADRVGPLADRFLALLAGTETPADAAAIMSWFCENPAHLKASSAGGGKERETDVSTKLVPVAELLAVHPEPSLNTTVWPTAAGGSGWAGFMHQVIAAFRKPQPSSPPGPITSPLDEDDEEDGEGASPAPDRSIPKAFKVFERLLEVLTTGAPERRHALVAFDLAQYLCVRLDPGIPRAKGWLRKIVESMSVDDVPDERSQDVAAAICALHAAGGRASLRHARQRLLALGISVSGGLPSVAGVAGFLRALEIDTDLSMIWDSVQAVRTLDEQRVSYLVALDSGTPSDDYPDLSGLVSEWPTLEKAISDTAARKRISIVSAKTEACEKHSRNPPLGELSNLRLYGFGIARNCCNVILVRRGSPS